MTRVHARDCSIMDGMLPCTATGCLPGHDHSARALNVIIETQALVAKLLQDGKCLVGLEVLKLNERLCTVQAQSIAAQATA